MSLLRFNNSNFYMLLHIIDDFKQVFTMFESFYVHHWNRVLFFPNILNKEYSGFYSLKMVSRKRTIYQYKQILDLSFLFTIKNVASGYTLCHLENYFFFLYISFKIMTRKSVNFISLNFLNLSFLLLFCFISTAILFPPWFLSSPPRYRTFFTFPLAYTSHSSHFHSYFPHFPHSTSQFHILSFRVC